MNYSLKSLRKKYERKVGQYNEVVSQIKTLKLNLKIQEEAVKDVEKARAIIQQVAKNTQKELQFHINEIVTLALSSVFEDEYEFDLDFVEKRGKTEAEIKLIHNGMIFKPQGSTGGGILDVISFALRVALWSLSLPKTRKVLILDEPFRNVSRNLHNKASLFLKEISDKLEIQIIIVSHSKYLVEKADKVFEVSLEPYKDEWKQSKIKEISNDAI